MSAGLIVADAGSAGTRDYIESLPHKETRTIAPINSRVFFTALELCFGRDKVVKAVAFLFNQKESPSGGVRQFKERLTAALDHPEITMIHPEDQKYIANVVHRYTLGHFR